MVMLADSGFKSAMMPRRLAAIAKGHSAAQLNSPASMKHAVVKQVWAGIRRTLGIGSDDYGSGNHGVLHGRCGRMCRIHSVVCGIKLCCS